MSDISQPSRASGDSERKGRILRLKLTDGRISCVGIEFAPLPYSLGQVCACVCLVSLSSRQAEVCAVELRCVAGRYGPQTQHLLHHS